MRNIKYIGTKATEDAFFDRTQIIWTPGKIDTVLDEAVATEMLRFAEFEDAGDAVAGAGVAVGALALDPAAGLLLGGAAPNAEQRAAINAALDPKFSGQVGLTALEANTSMVDLGALMTFAAADAAGWYDAGGTAHLTVPTGYDAVGALIAGQVP